MAHAAASSTPSSGRLFGHVLAALIGVLAMVGGIASFAKSMPPVMAMTLVMVGVLLPVLAWRSWHHSRPAWSFLISTVAVLATVMFFGAPKVAHLLGIGLIPSLVFPAVQIACVVALAGLRNEYRD